MLPTCFWFDCLNLKKNTHTVLNSMTKPGATTHSILLNFIYSTVFRCFSEIFSVLWPVFTSSISLSLFLYCKKLCENHLKFCGRLIFIYELRSCHFDKLCLIIIYVFIVCFYFLWRENFVNCIYYFFWSEVSQFCSFSYSKIVCKK